VKPHSIRILCALLVVLFWTAIITACKPDFVYMPDGQVDVWQTPSETALRGGGDCEDWAIREFYLSNVSFIAIGERNGKSHAWAIDPSGHTVDLLPTKATYTESIRFNESIFITVAGEVGDAKKIKKWAEVMRKVEDNE